MKNKLFIFSAILLISVMVAGGTFAWFTSSAEASLENSKMGTVELEVIEKGLDDIRIKNLGTIDSYIRVRLIPKWSDQSLSVSNIEIKIDSRDWKYQDGYYYYKKSLESNESTSNLINSIVIEDLTPEYEDSTFTLKVVAEGVQTTHQAWKDVWSIDKLPF